MKKLRAFLYHDMKEKNDNTKMKWVVETDETWCFWEKKRVINEDGEEKYKKSSITILWAIPREKDGNVVIDLIPNRSYEQISPFINKYVEKWSTLHTDELRTYWKVARLDTYKHDSVCHAKKEYARTDEKTGITITTNKIEGVWSKLKSFINHTLSGLKRQYIQLYIAEFTFRYNNFNKVKNMFWKFMNTCFSKAVKTIPVFMEKTKEEISFVDEPIFI